MHTLKMNLIWNICVFFLIIHCTIDQSSALNATKMTCNDVAFSTVGKLEKALSSSTPLPNLKVKFYVFTNSHRNKTELEPDNWTSLHESGLNTDVKTVILIHGYRSHGLYSWILEIKDKLLDKVYMVGQ